MDILTKIKIVTGFNIISACLLYYFDVKFMLLFLLIGFILLLYNILKKLIKSMKIAVDLSKSNIYLVAYIKFIENPTDKNLVDLENAASNFKHE